MLRHRTNRQWGRRGISVWRASVRVKALLASCQLRLEAWSEYVRVGDAKEPPAAEEEPAHGFQAPEDRAEGRRQAVDLLRNEASRLTGTAARKPDDGAPD